MIFLSFVLCDVLFESFVLSRLCQAVALVLGGRDLDWRVIEFSLVLWLWITCWRFVFVVVFFSFSLMVTMGVVNALIKGEIEDQVCPRTSGGSLLSDE